MPRERTCYGTVVVFCKSKTLQTLILQGLRGRSGGIRTRGLLVPNQTRYHTALHLEAEPMRGLEPLTC